MAYPLQYNARHGFINNLNTSILQKFENAYCKTKLNGVYYLRLKAPLSVQFELTYNCNQSCCFCYNIWKEKGDKPKMQDTNKELKLEIIDKLIANEVFSIIFSGGEPLLCDWLEELIQKVSCKGIEASLITNGILLTEQKANNLKKAGLKSIQISLHHYDESIHNNLVRKNTFSQSVMGIKNGLSVFGEKKINVNMVVLPDTYKDVYTMAKFLKSIGVKYFSVGTPSTTGELSKSKENVINKVEFQEVYNLLYKAKQDLNINTSITGGFPLCILPILNEESISMINNYCDAGLNQLVVDPIGNLRPCVCFNSELGNILNDELLKIWENHPFLKQIRELEYLPNECIDCNYVHICRGGCRASAYGYYGEICSIDPLMR